MHLRQPLNSDQSYRGPAACDGCPESVAHLLKTSTSKFEVTYVGPNEDVDISEESLGNADIYAQPGGPDLDKTWPEMEPHRDAVRSFVSGGGRYLGFCLGEPSEWAYEQIQGMC